MLKRDSLEKSAAMTGETKQQHFLLLCEKSMPSSPAQITTELLLSEGSAQPGII